MPYSFLLQSESTDDKYLSTRLELDSLEKSVTFQSDRVPGNLSIVEMPELGTLVPFIVCKNGCNEPNGKCTQGKCACEDDFEGDTCGQVKKLADWEIGLIVGFSVVAGIGLLVGLGVGLKKKYGRSNDNHQEV